MKSNAVYNHWDNLVYVRTDGNMIQTAVRSRGAVLIWTDTALYQMQFIGPPFTFGFKQLGSNCGAVGGDAAIDISGMAYWMGNDSFFMFDGAVKKIPCSVQDYVFDDIIKNAINQVFCASNSDFNEIKSFFNAFSRVMDVFNNFCFCSFLTM